MNTCATNRLSLFVPFLALTLCVSAARADLSSWPSAMKIDVSGYSRTEVLTNFPVLVVLSNTLAGFTYGAMNSPANGADLRFSVDTLNEINYEIDQWDTNGVSTVWVQVPAFSNTASLYAHWGYSASKPAYTTNGATWTNGYAGVYHLAEQVTAGGSGGLHADSTTNANTGTQSANGWTNGIIGRAQSFNGSANINCGTSASLNFTSKLTLSAWVKYSSFVGTWTCPVGRTQGGNWSYMLYVNSSTRKLRPHINSNISSFDTDGAIAADAWFNIVEVADGAYLRCYINGVEQTPGPLAYNGTINGLSSGSTLIGKDTRESGVAGIIDQVEISGVGRSSNWVWASYMQVVSNQPFLAYNTYATGAPRAPTIVNQAATNITTTSAWLNGTLSSTGTAATTVAVYWGTQDGGAPTSGLWQATNTWNAGDWAQGSNPSFHATPLTPDTFYYYRYAAWNSAGTNWPASSTHFLAGEVAVTAPDPAADENGDTGTFRISRGATNEPTAISYRFTGSAVLSTNYTLTPAGTNLTLAAGQASADITVNPLIDLANLSDTVVTLELLPGNFAAGTATNASVTISNVTPPAAHAPTSLTWTDSVSGTWDSFNTNHWSPRYVPNNGDSVFITNAFANNVDVDYAAVDFTGTNALNTLTLGNPTAGKTNSLLLGAGDSLQYANGITLNTGGRFCIGDGSTLTLRSAGDMILNGGSLLMTGGMRTNTTSTSGTLQINNGVYTQSGGTNSVGNNMYLANSAGQNATLNISGGRLNNNLWDLWSWEGNSTLNLSGGELVSVRDIVVCYNVYAPNTGGGGTHTWTISGGFIKGGATFGNNVGHGTVTITQTAGNANWGYPTLNRTATYNLQGGGVTNGHFYVNGTVNQTGGTMFNNFEIHIGSSAGQTGVYNLVNGTLRTRAVNIGAIADSAGMLTLPNGPVFDANADGANGNFTIGATSGSGYGKIAFQGATFTKLNFAVINQTGILQGWGTISGNNFGIMNGRVIADGSGVDQTLDLTGRVLTNTVLNATDKGWYAQNHGKLLLAAVAVNAATTNAYNWGASQSDAAPTLVNSARFTFAGLSGSGTLTGALLATNHSSVAAGLYKPLSVWSVTTNGFAATSATVTFRYDDAALANTGKSADLLLVKGRANSVWVRLPAALDTGAKTLTLSGALLYPQYAIDLQTPARGTSFIVH